MFADAKLSSSFLAAIAFAASAKACMLASFTYDPCTSSISGTLIDNGQTIGHLPANTLPSSSNGTPIPLSQPYYSLGIRAYIHTVSTSDRGRKAGWLSHITFHDSTNTIINSFELIRDANQHYSNVVYGCDDTIEDAWFYELGGWRRWGVSHPSSKGLKKERWEGRLRCDNEGLVWEGAAVATRIDVEGGVGRRATGNARRQASKTGVVEAKATAMAVFETIETPVVMFEEPALTAFATRKVGQAATNSLVASLAKLRSWNSKGEAGGALSQSLPGEVDRQGEVDTQDEGLGKRAGGFRMKNSQPGGGWGVAQGNAEMGMGEGTAGANANAQLGDIDPHSNTGTGLGQFRRGSKEGEAWKALVGKVAQGAAAQEETKVERRAAQTTSW